MSFEHFLWAFEIRQARLSAKNHFYKARQTATAFSLAHALHKRFFARNTAPLFFNGKFTLLLTNLLIFALKKREFSLSFWHFCEFLAKFHRKFTTFCHCEHFQNGLRPSLRARRSRSVAIQKTHFVRLKASSLLLRRVPRLATRWVRRGVFASLRSQPVG